MVGSRVRIARDETRWPSKGTWPQFRGRVGTVVEINRDHQGPELTEWGVVVAKVSPRPDRPGKFNHGGIVTCFKDYELTPILRGAAESPTEIHHGGGGGDSPRSKAEESAAEKAYRARMAAAHQHNMAIRWQVLEHVIADTEAKLARLRTKGGVANAPR